MQYNTPQILAGNGEFKHYAISTMMTVWNSCFGVGCS